MKLPERIGRIVGRKTTLVLLLVAVAAVATAYAASQLTVSNTGTVVNVGTNLFAVLDVPSSTTCSATTGTYSDTGLAISSWAVPVSGSQTKYSCIENTGSSAHTLTITETGSLPAGVTFSSSAGGTVGAGGFLLVSFTLTATSSAAVGASLSFTITIS